MLRLIGPLASLVSALIGASLGGWITYKVATEDTKAQMAMNAYNLYLAEVYHIWKRPNQGLLTEEEVARLSSAVSILMIYGSEKIICRALEFVGQIGTINPNKEPTGYRDIVLLMREEVMKEKIPGMEVEKEECAYLTEIS